MMTWSGQAMTNLTIDRLFWYRPLMPLSAAVAATAPPSEKRIAAALQHRFFLRLHMAAIVAATLLVGLGTTRLLFALHLRIFALRYGLAVLAGYAAFVALIKVWLWYIEFCESRDRSRRLSGASSGGAGEDWFDCLNLSSSGSSTFTSFSADTSVSFDGAGGRFGGGGATGSWDEGGPSSSSASSLVAASVASSSKTSSSSSSHHSSGGSGSGDDLGELVLVVLIIALLVAIVASFVWVVYAAPAILSEVAFNAALAGVLAHHSHKAAKGDWVGSVLRKTGLPFALILVLSIALGWWAQHYCPDALRLSDAIHCARPAN
jgi:hypothetical protein